MNALIPRTANTVSHTRYNPVPFTYLVVTEGLLITL